MSAPSPPLVWVLLVYAWVANYLIRMALSPLLPPIMAELSLSYTKAGVLATAFFYAYMAMQLPAGLLGDRWGRKRILLTGILLGAAASLLTGFAGSFLMLFLARLLTGVSQGSLFSNDRVIIATYTPKEKMALGQGVSFSGPGLGTTLGLFLAGALGAPLLFAEIGVRELGRSAFYASLQGLPAPFGLLFMGWVADWVRRRGISRKVVIALTVLFAGGSFAGMGLAVQQDRSPGLLTVLMLIASFFLWGTWGPLYASLDEIVPAPLLGTAFGFLNTICFVGALLGPVFTGWIKDITGSFVWAAYVAACGAGLGAMIALALRPTFGLRVTPSVAGADERQV